MSHETRPAIGTATEFRKVNGSPALGIASLILAVIIAASLPLTTILINLPTVADNASAMSGVVVSIQGLALFVAFFLGLVAVVTRRGRWWGVAALAITGSALVVALLVVFVSTLATSAAT